MIKDIRFMNGEAYLLKTQSLSLYDFEKQIKTIDYYSVYEKYKSQKDESGAEKAHFPAVNIVFYRSIFESGTVLKPMELVKEYFEYYKDEISVENNRVCYLNRKYPYPTVVGRLLRTYPSLIRDYDFFLKLQESKKFDQVIYSCKMDIEGKDIIIKSGDQKYEISLFVDTKRSKFFKQKKNEYRHKYGANEIQVPLQFREAERCGDFYLYDKSYIGKILQQMVRDEDEEV